jgi:hypothetical protein
LTSLDLTESPDSLDLRLSSVRHLKSDIDTARGKARASSALRILLLVPTMRISHMDLDIIDHT